MVAERGNVDAVLAAGFQQRTSFLDLDLLVVDRQMQHMHLPA